MIDVDHYKTWMGDYRVRLDDGDGRGPKLLTRSEAQDLRDALTRELEAIAQDEEQEPGPEAV
jgi:hypothetical protein